MLYGEYIVVMAAVSIANIVKTSLGPVGLDKMLVDEVGVCYSDVGLILCQTVYGNRM